MEELESRGSRRKPKQNNAIAIKILLEIKKSKEPSGEQT